MMSTLNTYLACADYEHNRFLRLVKQSSLGSFSLQMLHFNSVASAYLVKPRQMLLVLLIVTLKVAVLLRCLMMQEKGKQSQGAPQKTTSEQCVQWSSHPHPRPCQSLVSKRGGASMFKSSYMYSFSLNTEDIIKSL